jgi:hypothetical protein
MTTITNPATFTVSTEVSYQELWNALWGSDGSGMTHWCDKLRATNNHGIELYGAKPRAFKVHDYYEGKWYTVTLEDLARGYRLASEGKRTHCGSYPLTDLDSSDECVGDHIIQLAIFGELMYS